MRKFFERLDGLAGIETSSAAVVWLERSAFLFLALMLAAAPHSIAATQAAWITGMFLWVVRLFLRPRVKIRFGPLDWALWAFFGWSVLSSLLSYEPAISLDRLRGAALFLIFYFVIYNLRNLRVVYFAVFLLIFSCMVNVAVTAADRIMGRGVAVRGLRPDGPLAKAGLVENDAVFNVNGRKVRTPEEIAAAIKQAEISRVKFYRKDFEAVADVRQENVSTGTTAAERLGFGDWARTRNWRASGFYGHYTTYAEVLQLIASMVLGLLVAGFFSGKRFEQSNTSKRHSRIVFAALFVSLAGMCLALLLTVTRASQLAFMISGLVIFVSGASRKWLITAVGIGLPMALIGLFILQQSREIGFFDPNDLSIQYRRMMWNDGVRLWLESPRHFIVGVGMDSVHKNWQEWQLFDKGWQPMGHFHSTPIQLLAERGLPALILWLVVLGIYARTLWRGIRGSAEDPVATAPGTDKRRKQVAEVPDTDLARDWRSRGILLGCLGGMIGFFASGLVHYNLGDQEVAMVFFILMGVGIKVSETVVLSSPPDLI